MTRLRQKRPRLLLDSEPYRRLRLQVLERDRWRCQHCGSLADLQVHHLKSRSRLGDDAEHNLVTLCALCHEALHQKKIQNSSHEMLNVDRRSKRSENADRHFLKQLRKT